MAWMKLTMEVNHHSLDSNEMILNYYRLNLNVVDFPIQGDSITSEWMVTWEVHLTDSAMMAQKGDACHGDFHENGDWDLINVNFFHPIGVHVAR